MSNSSSFSRGIGWSSVKVLWILVWRGFSGIEKLDHVKLMTNSFGVSRCSTLNLEYGTMNGVDLKLRF